MNLQEHQAKQLFAAHGIPVPPGQVATTPAEARAIAARLAGRVAVKAQVLTGGRGKAGGIRLAETPDEAAALAGEILGMTIKGHGVRSVLIDPACRIARELYLGVVVDRARRCPVIMVSREGGVEIETVAAARPDAILQVAVDPLVGLRPFHTRRLTFGLDLPAELHAPFATIVSGLFKTFRDVDATLTEINPLVVTEEGALLALDGKVSIDDNALFRQPAIAAMRDVGEETIAERQAREAGLNYVELGGSIGCLVNGAGLAMATMDVIQLLGAAPANFLDIGGGAQADKVETAMRILLADARVKSVLINIFGGMTRGDEVARGIRAALERIDTTVPFVVRIVGTNAAEARTILAEARMQTAASLVDAARLAIAAAGGRAA